MLNPEFELNSVYPVAMFPICAQMVKELEQRIILRNIFFGYVPLLKFKKAKMIKSV